MKSLRDESHFLSENHHIPFEEQGIRGSLGLEDTVFVEEHCKDHTICHMTGASRAVLEEHPVASFLATLQD